MLLFLKSDTFGSMQTPHTTILSTYALYLFDADGTLIDTADLVVECFMRVLEHFQVKRSGRDKITKDTILELMGLPLRYQMELFFGELKDSEYNEILDYYRDYQDGIYQDYLKLFPGVKETLKELKRRGRKLAIITSRSIYSLQTYLDALEIAEYFDLLITPESTTRHKPYPDPVFKALEELKAPASEALFIGDAPFDIKAGNSAGVHTVFVNWSHNNAAELKPRPDYCIDSMEELL